MISFSAEGELVLTRLRALGAEMDVLAAKITQLFRASEPWRAFRHQLLTPTFSRKDLNSSSGIHSTFRYSTTCSSLSPSLRASLTAAL